MLTALLMAAALFCACGKVKEPDADEPSATDGEALATEAAPEETEAVPEETEAAPEETEAAPTEEPVDELIESLLPDWELSKVTEDDLWYSYSGVTYTMLSDYIVECSTKGFRHLYDYKEVDSLHILYRDDIWIEIRDGTHDYRPEKRGCALSFIPSHYDGGMTGEDVIAATGDMGIGMTPAAALDISPDGLYAITGLQLYRVLYNMMPDGDPVSTAMMNYQYFLVGGGEALLFGKVTDTIENPYIGVTRATLYTDFRCFGFGDVDADGEYEAIMLGSSAVSVTVQGPMYVIKAVEGKPKIVHRAYYEISSKYVTDLVSRGGKVYLASYIWGGYDRDKNPIRSHYSEQELVFDRGKLQPLERDDAILFKYWGRMD